MKLKLKLIIDLRFLHLKNKTSSGYIAKLYSINSGYRMNQCFRWRNSSFPTRIIYRGRGGGGAGGKKSKSWGKLKLLCPLHVK